MANVILVAGYARAGKDTVADYLVKNYMYAKVKFAEPMYLALTVMFRTRYANAGINLMPDYIDRHKNDLILHTTVTWRHALQTLGTEWGRTYIDEEVWCRLACDKLIEHAKVGYPSVISDCRFLNEATFFKTSVVFQDSFELWYIHSNRAEPQTHHASEQDIEQIAGMTHIHINNTGTIADLHNVIDRQLKQQ